MKEVKWIVQDIRPMKEFGVVIGANIYLAYTGYLSGTEYLEYIIMVDADGTWTCLKFDGHRWRETNGVCEDAEPVFKAALPKAQALAILKG
jgi:hypothetical protein